MRSFLAVESDYPQTGILIESECSTSDSRAMCECVVVFSPSLLIPSVDALHPRRTPTQIDEDPSVRSSSVITTRPSSSVSAKIDISQTIASPTISQQKTNTATSAGGAISITSHVGVRLGSVAHERQSKGWAFSASTPSDDAAAI